MTAATVLLLALVAIGVVLVLQPISLRLALLAFLTLLHVDVSAATGGAALGTLLNAVTALVLPVVLLVRVGRRLPRARRRLLRRRPLRTPAFVVAAALVLVVAVGSTWSPQPGAAAAYLAAWISHALLFALFFLALEEGTLDVRLLGWAVVAALARGLRQSTVFEAFIGGRSSSLYFRFSSFVSAQTYAVFLANALLLVLWQPVRWRTALLVIGAVALFATGSRTAFLGFVAGVGVWFVLVPSLTRWTLGLALALATLAGLAAVPSETLQATRIGELSRAVAEPGEALANVGTLRWRVGMFGAVLEAVGEASPGAAAFGHGSAATGAVALRYDPRYVERGFSPTRVAHNEFLRFLYEFGVLGAGLLAILVAMIVASALRGAIGAARRPDVGPWVGPLASALPLALATLALENVTQAPALPGIASLLLVLAFHAHGRLRLRECPS